MEPEGRPATNLLIPEPIDLLPHQGTLLEEWLPVLSQTGLDIERFGPTSYVVRAVPAILGSTAVGPLVLELLEELSEWKSTDSLETLITAYSGNYGLSKRRASRADHDPAGNFYIAP